MLQEQRRRRVPGVVQPSLTHAGLRQQGPPGAVVAARVDRLAVLLSEDEVRVVPLRPGRHPLRKLRCPVCPQR